MALTDTNHEGKNNDDNNSSHLFVRPLFGARKPVDALQRSSRLNPYRSAQVQTFPGTTDEEVAVLNSPLTNAQKMMLEDAFIADPVVRRGVTLFAKFLLGKRTHTTVDINKEFMTPQAQEQALATTFKQQEIDELKTMIDKINRQVKFREKIEAAVIQALVGGRSALLVEKQGEMPIDLKVLNWGKLGRVFADKDTWQLLGVEYADRPKDKPLLADELLYFTWQDYNISPDSLYHGLSVVQPIADISETVRLITSEDLKESARTSWASSGIVQFPANTSQSRITEFLAGFYPGTWNGTSQAVEIKTHDLDPKVDKMMAVAVEGQRMIHRGLGVPSFLMGFEQITNRATSELVMHAWRESDLNHARTWLQGILEPQWYDSLVAIRFPDIDLQEMAIKAKLEFEDITMESLKDRADTVIPLLQAGLITLEKALKILDMEDILEQLLAEREQRRRELEAEAEKLKQQKAEQLEQFRQQQQQQEPQEQKQRDEEEKDLEDDDEEELRVRRRRASIIEEVKQAALASIPQPQQQQQQQQEPPRDDTKRRLAEAEHKVRMELLEKQRNLIERMNLRIAKYEGQTAS